MAAIQTVAPVVRMQSGEGGPVRWALYLRGIAGILFGLLAFLMPGVTLLSLAYVFAAYAAVDGAFAIVAAARAGRRGVRWGWLLFEGVLGLLAAAGAVLLPGMTVLLYVYLVGGWAVLSGILLVGAAFALPAGSGRGWLAFGGIVSVLYGVLLVAAPGAGAVVLAWWLGAYALVFGVAMIIGGRKLGAPA